MICREEIYCSRIRWRTTTTTAVKAWVLKTIMDGVFQYQRASSSGIRCTPTVDIVYYCTTVCMTSSPNVPCSFLDYLSGLSGRPVCLMCPCFTPSIPTPLHAKVGLARPMERVVRLDLAPRLDTPPTFRLYVEIMASRSNVILVAVDQPSGVETIAACAYQVSPSKSVRPLSTGQD